jgi:uncharacterized protein (TIGR00369 family)
MAEPPSPDRLRLSAEDLNRFFGEAFGATDELSAGVVEMEPGRVLVRRPVSMLGLRPGNVISGPTMMSLADMAVYALVLGHIGIVPMAVTTSLTMHFLRPAKPGNLFGEARLLRLGRRIATAEVRLWSESPERIAAHATVAYAIPDGVS